MPKSRGRKNKKSNIKTHSRKKQDNDTEVFNQNGVELIRDGKNIYLKNTRSIEKQKRFNEELAKNRPLQLENMENGIDRVIEIFTQYDQFTLLGALAYNHVTKHADPNDDGLSEVTLEYGLSFATAMQEVSSNEPPKKILHELIYLLEQIRHQYTAYVMTESVTGKYSEIEGRLRFKTIMEALYIRGNAYMKHAYTIYKELFSGHDQLLQSKYGFTSSEILETILQLEDSFCCRVSLSTTGMPHPACHARFLDWSGTKSKAEIVTAGKAGKHFIDFFGEENPDLIVEKGQILHYNINDVTNYKNLFKIRIRYGFQKNVVDAISHKFGDNFDFLNPKHKGLPLNESVISSNPIIEHEGDYYLFDFALPTRSLFLITENLIAKADSNYYKTKFLGNKYSKSRDNYLETKATELFKKIIPNGQAYPNCKYKTLDDKGKKYETEIDLLLKSGNAVYLIEMKAGGLSASAKRGALKSLTGSLKESVGYGAYQSYRALNYIMDDDAPEFLAEDGTVVPIDKDSKFFRITITLEHLADLVAYMYDLKEIGVIDKNIDFAWTCSLFDLMIFSEILASEDDLIDYLEQRLPLYQRSEMEFQDEIDILGYFLEHDLVFDEKMISKLDSFRLNKYGLAIDDYFDKGGAKPLRKNKKKYN